MMRVFHPVALATLCLCSYPGMGKVLLRGRSHDEQAPSYQEGSGIDVCPKVLAFAMTSDKKKGRHEPEVDFACELSDGRTIPIKGTADQKKQLKTLLEDGRLVSAESNIEVLSVSSNDDIASLPLGRVIVNRGTSNGGNSRSHHSHPDGVRNLATEGPKSLLAVRVTDSEGRVHPDSAETISENIFGHELTVTSQVAACSYGKYTLTNQYDVDILQHLSAPGVLDIEIKSSLTETRSLDLGLFARDSLEEKLGFRLDGSVFHHVMFIYERCYIDCGWAAFAFINHWVSVYVSGYYKMLGTQMHEIGHNLNLAHSGGLNGREYTDRSCYMSDVSNVGAMCWNPAKTYQLAKGGSGWYSENAHDIAVWDSAAANEKHWWIGKIIGIADYKNNPNSRPVVVKIESGGHEDLYVGFNRAKGINEGVIDARNQVTVIQAGNDGGYSQSYMKAILSPGESYVVTNWRGSSANMTIRVSEINLNADPAYADVLVVQDPKIEQTNDPTAKPTSYPTKSSTRKPPKNYHDLIPSLDTYLISTFDFDSKSNGNMWMVRSLCDLEITSLFIHTSVRGAGMVRAYTRTGSYKGFEDSADGWTIIFHGIVEQLGRGSATLLELFTRVAIRSGSYQSFYVVADNELVYTRGSQEFNKYISDSCIEFYEGSGVGGEFGAKATPRVWNGIMEYDVKKNITLNTTYAYDSGSNGNVFLVKALRNIEITSLAINTMTKGVGAVKVYSRPGFYDSHEHNSDGWNLIYDNAFTQMSGRGQPTLLDNFDSFRLPLGKYQSIYVYAEKKLVYKKGLAKDEPFVRDDSLIIYEGIAINDHFGSVVFSPRVWSGSITYQASFE